MKGKVRTEKGCPECGKKFQETIRGLECVKCRRIPAKYYVDFWWKGERLRVFTDKHDDPFTSYAAADRFLTIMRATVDAGTFNPKDYIRVEIRGLQFANYAMAWVERRRQEVEQELLSRGYLRTAESYIRNHMIPFFKNRNIKDIYEGLIDDFKSQLPKHLKPHSIKNIMGVLQKIFADAYRKRRDIARMPVFPEVPLGRQGFAWLQVDDQEKILAEITDPVRKAFFIFMFREGCRPGEARAMKWKHILWDIKKAVICAAMDEEHFKEKTKEGDVRILHMPPPVIDALEAIPQGGPEEFVFTFRGRPFNHKLIDKTWRRATKAAGINIKLYHGTRHSAASQAASDGVDMKVIQAVLGHKSIASTQRYAHLHPSTLMTFWDHKEDRQQTVSKPKEANDNILKYKGKNG